MVTCEHVLERLHLLVSHKLDAAEADEICAHAYECAGCRQALAEHVRLARLLGDISWVSPGEPFD